MKIDEKSNSSVKGKFNVDVDSVLCKGCGYCREMCSQDIFKPSESFNSNGFKPMLATETEGCIGCLKCFYVCPEFAVCVENSGR